MRGKEEMARVSIDIPKEQHRILKAQAALSGKSLQQLFLDAISEVLEKELWLFDPANKEIVEQLKRGLQQEAKTDWESIKKNFE